MLELLNKDDIQFLKDLQERIRKEDKAWTREPVLWGIMQDKSYPTSDEYAEDYILYDKEGLCELTEGDIHEYLDELKVPACPDYTLEDKLDILNEKGYNIVEIPIAYQKNLVFINGAGLFFSKEQALEHLKRQSHNYNDTAKVYAISAWDNPEMTLIHKILKEMDFTELS